MNEPDHGRGPLDNLTSVFIKALEYIENPFLYAQLVHEWNEAVSYCQKTIK